MRLGGIIELPKITGTVEKNTKLSGNIGSKTINISGRPYDGEYVFKPTFKDQFAPTKNAVLDGDIMFAQISVNKAANNSGGNTIVIGD